MPKLRGVIYREEDGSAPFGRLVQGTAHPCKGRGPRQIERPRELGHELRRPEADFLRDGIYELRATTRGVHYRILYFFHKQIAAVLAHGVIKESAVPNRDINLAIRRKLLFEANPSKHTLEEN